MIPGSMIPMISKNLENMGWFMPPKLKNSFRYSEAETL
ncbi:hypothetical protein C723_2423 [Christiangramia flava JLT2011]|uniref:Uncharacterized protein n=1 Tax=Christiangramia flava JLT2011 TaxID=1229726 RepID=A0A1L7I1U5_9FLAO|nr:hypothetical protein GRFL_0308 [Christiangramia flava JLT2011]OSS38705.1 hypothetical protein C723_2423 [Christiangramia flava JLT2011]